MYPAGQDVRLSYHLRQPSTGETPGWKIDLTSYGVSSLFSGFVGRRYSANIHNNDLIMSDDRSGTWYQCVLLRSGEVVENGNITILRVAGE